MKLLGILFGAKVMIDTNDDDLVQRASQWLELLDKRYRAEGEEQIKIEMANLTR